MKILGILGDRSFLDYGGTVIYQEGSASVYALHFEPLPDDAEQVDGEPRLVYLNEYEVERRKLVRDDDGKPYYVPSWYDAEKARHSPDAYGEWWDDKLGEMCQSWDIAPEDFRRLECSADPAKAWDILMSPDRS